MKIIKELLYALKMDIYNLRGKFFLFIFNLLPDFYLLRAFSNLFLILGGCKINIFRTYIRKNLSIDSLDGVKLGRHGFINKGFLIEGNGKVVIGERFQIGPNTQILTTNHVVNSIDQIKNVTIGNDVWIGASVIITPGTCICNNVSIGAGAIVASDIKEPGLWAGVPAKKIK